MAKKLDFELIINELEWQFSKSSGPGGQHVNTTDSKATLTWSFTSSDCLTGVQVELIKKNLKTYLNKNKDRLQLSSSQYRSREQNRNLCLRKLKNLLENKAFFKPKTRIATKPSKAAIKKRLDSKKKASQTKQNRKKVNY